jgi:hypothetical protein
MEALGYAYLGILICLEILAFIVGCVGIIHVRDLGGRLAGLAYGVPTIVMASALPVVVWLASPGIGWWHAIVGIPFLLGCLSIWYGFQNRSTSA